MRCEIVRKRDALPVCIIKKINTVQKILLKHNVCFSWNEKDRFPEYKNTYFYKRMKKNFDNWSLFGYFSL